MENFFKNIGAYLKENFHIPGLGLIWGIFILQFIQLPTWSILDTLFGITKINKTLDITYTLSFSGAILAFWYGYKRYERDKELDLLDKYGKKYDELNKNNDLQGIIDLWEEEFFLHEKGYLSGDLWYRIEDKIEQKIHFILDKISRSCLKEYKKTKGNNILDKDSSDLVGLFSKSTITSFRKISFGRFIVKKLEEVKNDYEKLISGKIKNKYRQPDDDKILPISVKLIETLINGINDLVKINKDLNPTS